VIDTVSFCFSVRGVADLRMYIMYRGILKKNIDTSLLVTRPSRNVWIICLFWQLDEVRKKEPCQERTKRWVAAQDFKQVADR